MVTWTADGSIVDGDQVLYFSMERFISDITGGTCCLMCGCPHDPQTFSEEHVIPKWVLRRFDLVNDQLTLPNGESVTYGSNTVPCCKDCNALLGTKLEEPVSELLCGGYRELLKQLDYAVPLIFRWLCFVVFKTHYRDRSLRFNLDRRKGDLRIADLYRWEDLHHLHAVARSAITGCKLQTPVIGSIHLAHYDTNGFGGRYDYSDLYPSQTVLIRMDDIAIVSVLNDSCGVHNATMKMFEGMDGPLSSLQIREILARSATANLHIEDRPVYSTEIDPWRGTCSIQAKMPSALKMRKLDYSVLGIHMFQCCRDIIEHLAMSNEEKERALAELKDGHVTYLFKDDGSFNRNSIFIVKE